MKKILFISLLIFFCGKIFGQHGISFQHLNTPNGLSYTGIYDLCVDLKDNLWIATGNGLNMFNGKTVEKYFASEYPQLQNSNVIHVTCDSSNRIWILTAGGNVNVLDEKRQMHHVGIYKNNSPAKTGWILNSQHGGIILWTNKGQYFLKANGLLPEANDSVTEKYFSLLSVKGFDTLASRGFSQVFHYDDNNYLFITEDALYKVNYKTQELDKKYIFPHCTALIKWRQNELLMYDRISNEIKSLDLSTQTITYPFKKIKDQFGKEVTAYFRFAEKISAVEYLFTTFNEGIYIYNEATQKIYCYKHSLTDPFSLSNNSQATIAAGKNGWVFISCDPNGVSYFNTKDFIGNQNVFADNKGNGYDGYISGIATKDNDTYYLGTAEGLLQWKRNTNTTAFINYPGENGGDLLKKEEVNSVVIDNKDRIWAATNKQGIIVIDKNNKLVRHIRNNFAGKDCVKLQNVFNLGLSPTGEIWACGQNGICRINTNTFKVDNFEEGPLAQFNNSFCSPLLFTGKDDLWFAASQLGVYHYNIANQKLENYNITKGLISNYIFALNCDSLHNIYIGTLLGLNILFPNGRIKTITQKDGLLIDRAEGLLLDKNNHMWIGNDIGLACYNINDSSISVFDERYGLSVYGFRVGAYIQAPNGEFIFGTPHGLQYFQPDSLLNRKIILNTLISKIETKNISSNITSSAVFNLSPQDNLVTFYFGSVDYTPHLRTYYQYKLEGVDKDWINIADQHAVRYNALQPGKYLFKVRISNDKKNWQPADNEVTVIIATSFYATVWFKILAALVFFLIAGYIINYFRKRQIEKRNRLETELVITFFASKINSHMNTGEMLWDVAKNCISKLHFEDCVIYLKDEARNVLVQKAACGPKSPIDFTIQSPIEIPVGKGITGAVAQSGLPEIVNNTDIDSRYIKDDKKRLSEIAVPICINNNVVGVIDSEHRQRNFFTQNHLSILQTIAVLCANQIQKTKAEEDKQKATIELWENKQKATESRLQSLRLQMNPHFLFNALNSIQQMILGNEEMVATRYLSRFSKLLRTVLVYSDKETISLKEEIEILKMYVELESVRFRDSFTYTITCDESIETEEIKIPTLLVQPFVENAIWHGLMHKENNRHLKIHFIESGDSLLCLIEDNGIGRKRSMEMKNLSGKDKQHASKGISVSEERLKSIKNSSGRHGSIHITDLSNANGESLGTAVIINFPIQNKS